MAIPPGDTIREELDARGVTVENFAAAVNLTESQAEQLLTGALSITPELAELLHSFFDTSTKFWLNLETAYREALAAGKPQAPIVESAPPEVSGKLLIRLPKSLHQALKVKADSEGVSVNTLMLTYIAQGFGRQEGVANLDVKKQKINNYPFAV